MARKHVSPEIAHGSDEREQAVFSSQESEARIRAMFRALSEGVFFLNPDGDVVEMNDAVERIHGYSHQYVSENADYLRSLFVHSDGTPFRRDELPGLIVLRTGKAVHNVEIGVPKSDGTLVWVLVNAEPVRDESGQRIGAVVSGSDITESKQLMDELGRARDELEMRVRDRTEELCEQRYGCMPPNFGYVSWHGRRWPGRRERITHPSPIS